MKEYTLWMSLLLLMLAGCSSDDDTIGYDAEYQIKYYSQPPYANSEQGTEYYRLTPNAKAPYELLVIPKNDKGRKALEHMAEKEDGVILNISHRAYYYNQPEKDSIDHYFVTSTQYFECPDLYVSDNYYYPKDSGIREGDYCQVMSTITVNIKEGADIKNLEKEYKNVMTLICTRYRDKAGLTRYIFNCHLNNSYEVLYITEKLNKHKDVNWADAHMYSPAYLCASRHYLHIGFSHPACGLG